MKTPVPTKLSSQLGGWGGSRSPRTGFDELHVLLVDEATCERLSKRSLDELESHERARAVQQRPTYARHGDGAELDTFLLRHVAVILHDALRDAKATPGPGRGQRQVRLSREYVRQVSWSMRAAS